MPLLKQNALSAPSNFASNLRTNMFLELRSLIMISMHKMGNLLYISIANCLFSKLLHKKVTPSSNGNEFGKLIKSLLPFLINLLTSFP